MTEKLRKELVAVIQSQAPLQNVVALLRQYKEMGVTQGEVYALLQSLRGPGTDESTSDRVLEIADFVAGFCSPHMKVWDN